MLCLFALVLLIDGAMLRGQTNAGTLVGTVVDPSGLPVAKAIVTVRNQATRETTKAASNEAGTFRFNEVKPGIYSAVTTAAGFKKSEASGIVVSISQTAALTVQLELGQAEETVTVSASAAELQTESSDISTSVGTQLVDNLPISVGSGEMRSIIDFTFLVPGVVGGENVNKIAGGQATGSTIEVDGGSIDTVTGGNYDAAAYTPSVDAVQEFTILQSGYPAQYGRTTGGIVNFGTLSGTNQLHGKAYDLFHNTVLNANKWWNNLRAAADPSDASLYKRPVDMKNEYGFTVGGPVYLPHLYDGRNRTFFFYSWEQYRQNFGNVAISSVPTQANRNGDFSATLTSTVIGTNPCDGQSIYQGEIFDPTTTTQVGNVYCRTPFSYNGQLNHVNPALFSKVAGNVLSYMPLPQTTALTQNYVYRNAYPIHITGQTIRIDHNFSTKNKIFGSYNPHHFQQSNQGQVIPGPGSPAVNLTQTTDLHDIHLAYDHAFSASIFNHLVLSLFRFTNFPEAPAARNGINYSSTLGLGSNLGGNLFPTFSWGENYIGMGSWLDYKDYQNHIEVADNWLYTSGKHTLNVGADVRFQEFTRNYMLFYSGDYTFSRNETAGTNILTTQTGNGFASFMLGQVSSAYANVPAVVPQRRQEYAAVYVQDDYKPFPNLILNIGLRYDVDVPFSEHYGNVNNWNLTLPDTNLGSGILGGLVFSGTGTGRSGLSSRLADTYYKDFAPRLGFAWSPKALHGKTAIRGNYGFMYGPMPMNFPINGETGFSNNPNFTDSLMTGSFSSPFLLDSGFPSFTKGVITDPFQLDNTGSSPYYTARSYGRVATIENYGLEIQQDLPYSTILSLAYAGNRGTHLSSNLVCLNCLAQKYYTLGSALSQTYSATQTVLSGYKIPYSSFTGSLAQGLQSFPQVGSITTSQENIGQSSYNALYAKLQHSFRNGFSMLAAYTLSKTFTNADSTLIGELGGGYQNPFNLKDEKAISAMDYPQVLVVSYVAELPFGKGKQFLNSGGVLNAVVGGWSIGGVHRAQSGSPANFGCATELPGDSPCFRFSLNSGVSVYSTAKQSGNFKPLSDVYFNTNAFVDPNANTRIAEGGGYQYGNLRRYVSNIRYPVSPNSDFSFIKNTAIANGLRMEIRGELFNAFNQHRLGTPNQSPNSTAFGQITGTQNSARVGQLTMRVTF
jgi:outer membrane receptor protein involved in Fe transport